MKVTAPSLVMGTCVKLLQEASKTMLDLDPQDWDLFGALVGEVGALGLRAKR